MSVEASSLPSFPWHQITPFVFVRDSPLPILPNNVFLIRSHEPPNRYVLVDTGAADDGDALLESLVGLPIEFVILTHTHYDHTGSVKRIQSRQGVNGVQTRVIVHELEREFLNSGVSAEALPGTCFVRMVLCLAALFMTISYEPCDPDCTYPFEDPSIESQLLDTYGIRIHLFPGHTPGHLCIEWRGPDETERDPISHLMILGDLIFQSTKLCSRKDLYPYDYPFVYQSRDIAANRQLLREAFVKILSEVRPQALFASHVCAVVETNLREQEPIFRIEGIDVDAIVRLFGLTEEELGQIEIESERAREEAGLGIGEVAVLADVEVIQGEESDGG